MEIKFQVQCHKHTRNSVYLWVSLNILLKCIKTYFPDTGQVILGAIKTKKKRTDMLLMISEEST